MARDQDHPLRRERGPIFSRTEIRWLGALVIAAVAVSTAAAMVPDKTIANLLGGSFAPAPQPASADS